MTQSFIERQFPVSKLSKESYKERKAVQSQTLTGLGKWWGRKPLVLVRAAILGCLMPASDNPEKDMEIFLKIMSMDNDGLLMRKEKSFTPAELSSVIKANRSLWAQYGHWFEEQSGKLKLLPGAPRSEMELAAFSALGYDQKIALGVRPEQLENISDSAWNDINHYLGTNAHSLEELINQLSLKRCGHNAFVGDCFAGGGSIPFEAARMGCNSYGSDLNPVAGLLSWSDIHVCGCGDEIDRLIQFQKDVYNCVDQEILDLGIETNELGDRADAYLYCTETRCPECNALVPMSVSWLIGQGSKTVAKLVKHDDRYDFDVVMNASAAEMEASKRGTVASSSLVCPACGKTTPISTIRHDITDENGNTIYGLRKWGEHQFEGEKEDVFHDRLFAIRYKKANGERYYRAPNDCDIENEEKVTDYVKANIVLWQQQGIIPSMKIESGDKTEELIRTRGWTYWHHLFNARQLLEYALIQKVSIKNARSQDEIAVALLSLNRCLNWNSKLCSWGVGQARESMAQTFYNQALNPLWNYGTRALSLLSGVFYLTINQVKLNKDNAIIKLMDARDIEQDCDLWITDPPYADAINYHELTEFFIAWDKTLLLKAFPEWYADSKRILAVRGDEHFSQTMIDIYSNLTRHMNDDGMQVVMFTHSDPAVWAQLALIMWKAGLTVTAAWNIQTETDASGFKEGNYVKGTVLLVLRKQQGDDEAFLDELAADIKNEVRKQIESMQKLDDKEDPNFSDPDYVLAAYAASLKVLTGYKAIGEIDLDYELNLAIHEPAKSEVVKLIERAKKIAYDFIIPLDFNNFLWRDLSPAERFYIKGLEAEKHGNYQVSTYQEYARGFGLSAYGQLMANEKANSARLKTPQEFAMRTVSDLPDFEASLLRLVLAAIHIAIKEDESPDKGFWYVKNNVEDYWNKRDMLKQLLVFLKDVENIDTMPHWQEAAAMASHIYALIENDHV